MSLKDTTLAPLVVPFLFDTSATGRHALQAEADSYAVRILRMVNRARAVAHNNRSETLCLLAARRRTLCDLLTAYQKFKHTRVFDPVVRLGSGSSKVIARTLKIECMQMGATFSEYNSRWLRTRHSEWQAYQQDMLEVSEQLIGHIVSERRAIKQLLDIADLYGGPLKREEDGDATYRLMDAGE